MTLDDDIPRKVYFSSYGTKTDMAGNVRKVPQVVVDGKYIGGYSSTELYLRGRK